MTNTIRYSASTYGSATQDGSGRWAMGTPTATYAGEWGTFRIEAGATWDTSGTAYAAAGSVAVRTAAGTDITTIGSANAPTLIESLQFGEPYGELTGSLALTGAQVFDDLSAINCQPGSNIDIWRRQPGGTVDIPYWHGIIASAEVADGEGIATGVTLQLVGALYGEASVRQHQPLMLDTSSDVGTWTGRALDYELYSRPFTPMTRFTYEATTTGIDVRYRGSRGQSTIDYLDEVLALAQQGNAQWTISRAYDGAQPRPRHYYLRPKQPDQAGGSVVDDLVASAQTWFADSGLWPNNTPVTSGTAETDAVVTFGSAVVGVNPQSAQVYWAANIDYTGQAYLDLGSGYDDDTVYTLSARVRVASGGSPIGLTLGSGYPVSPFYATTTAFDEWQTLTLSAPGATLKQLNGVFYVTLERTDWTVATTAYVDWIKVTNGIAVQQNTVAVGGYGVSVSLSWDAMTAENVLYGEGVHPVDSSDLSGSRWRNAQFPMLAGTVPSYPDRVGTASTWPIAIGDTDADFDIDAVTLISSQLRLGGWPGATITSTFSTAIGNAITAWKQDIDYANTNPNIGGTAEWAKLWESGTGQTDLSSGWFKPLAWDPAVSKYTYTAAGDVAGTAATYDPSVLRVESTVSFGENIPKSRARKFARRIVNTGTPPIVGTVTLTMDPVDENGSPRSRFDIREGGWVQLDNFPGGTATSFYISGVTHVPEAASTTLTVSTVPFDLLDLSTRVERNRAAKSDPARSFYSQRTATTRPYRSAVGWDAESGAGQVPSFAAVGSAWTVQKFVGAQYGQIASLRVDVDPPVPFALAVFGGSVAGTAIPVTSPLGTVSGGYPTWWTHPDNEAWLTSHGHIETWGEFDNAAGYYPGEQGATGTAGSVTGALEDSGSFSFASLEPPWLWAAVWPQTSGTVTVRANMRIVQDE